MNSIAKTAGPGTRRVARNDESINYVAAQIIALLKDYWPPIVIVIAALAFWAHHKIAALLDENDDEE